MTSSYAGRLFLLISSHSYIAAAERSEGGRGNLNTRASNNIAV